MCAYVQCGYRTGADRLYLRLPVDVVHVITEDSPLVAWRDLNGFDADKNSEIVVTV
jgi:hypothetical protein